MNAFTIIVICFIMFEIDTSCEVANCHGKGDIWHNKRKNSDHAEIAHPKSENITFSEIAHGIQNQNNSQSALKCTLKPYGFKPLAPSRQD